MESITGFLEWLQALPLAVFIHKRPWAFTTVEVVHVFAVAMVIGTIAIVDWRLLGFASPKRPFKELSRQLLPFTWAAFAVAVIAGTLLFISRATEYFVNPVFWIKMALIVVAGINMLIFIAEHRPQEPQKQNGVCRPKKALGQKGLKTLRSLTVDHFIGKAAELTTTLSLFMPQQLLKHQCPR